MNKAMLFAAGVLAALTWGLIAPATAETAVEAEGAGAGAPQFLQEKRGTGMPSVTELTVSAGTAEGHKTPLEIVLKAIAAAKASKLGDLKACFAEDNRDYLDGTTYFEGKKSTQLKVIAIHLSKFEPELLTQLAQGKVGHYAVVVAPGEGTQRLIRTTFKKKNWYLADAFSDNYVNDYSAGLGAISKAIAASDIAAIKKALPQEAISMLDFLSGVEEGVDPYALLAKRLKTITNDGGKPHILLRNPWGNETVFWFHGKGGDTFLALTYRMDYGDFRNPVFRAELNLPLMANFLNDPAQAHKLFVSDWGK